jgi:His-Xaa-Ser system protein HxsD
VTDSTPIPFRPFAFTIDGGAVAMELDATIYSVGAVLRAGYKLTDRAYVHIARDEESDHLIVSLLARDSRSDLGALAGELTNEMLDQRLREMVAAETAAVRELIFAQAFSEGNLLDPDRDEGDYEDDPLGLATAR